MHWPDVSQVSPVGYRTSRKANFKEKDPNHVWLLSAGHNPTSLASFKSCSLSQPLRTSLQ